MDVLEVTQVICCLWILATQAAQVYGALPGNNRVWFQTNKLCGTGLMYTLTNSLILDAAF